MAIRVVVVEDDEATRRRWVRLLNESSGYRCAGEYSSGEMALRRLRPGQCEVALVDLQLPGMSGIELIRALAKKFPEIAPLVMTVNDDRSAVLEAIREGAAGYLLKRGDPKNLLIRLGELAANEFPLSPPIGQLIRDELRPRKTDGQIPRLTPAEEEVLRWLDQGLSNKEIALQRAVDEVTVRDQLSRIYGKLDVGNRVAALAKLRRLGWGPPP